MAYDIGDQFNINLKNKPELKEALQQLADENNLQSPLEIITQALRDLGYLDGAPKKKAPKPNIEASDTHFVAKIHKMDKQAVQKMREDLYRRHRFEDPQIIAHWAEVHRQIEEQSLLMVRPAKSVAAKIVEIGTPLVDNGEIPSLGHFISALCKKSLTEPKKEKGGFFS